MIPSSTLFPQDRIWRGRRLRQVYRILTLASALSLGPCLRAQAEDQDSGGLLQEEFTFIGWKADECSAAIQHLRMARSSVGVTGFPTWGRIGTMEWPPHGNDAKVDWLFEYDGLVSWNPHEADTTVETLVRSGYSKPGHVESIRPDTVAPRPGLESVLRSTLTFESRGVALMPPKGFFLSRVHYSPLDTCALLVYQRDAAEDAYRYMLLHVVPGTRRTRSRAHVTNGLLLYKGGNLDGAQEELGIAAAMDPNYALARYHDAALLSAQGRFEEAITELKAAVKLDRRYGDKARTADEFEAYRSDPRFQEALK